VVGFRAAPGRVPVYPAALGWWPFSIAGPMARTVEDVALLLSVMAGPDPRVPIAIAEPGSTFAAPLDRDFRGVRIAWSGDFGGLPIDPRIAAVLEAQRPVFAALGCEIDEGQPDFDGADEVFKGWRAWSSEALRGPLLAEHRHQIKETILGEVEYGAHLTGPQLARLELRRTAIYHRVREFMATREFMVFPTTQVPPFPIAQRYITAINGVPMDSYIDWMRSCYFISITGLPAISVPCGFTSDGLPVGLQIVGRHQDELGVLQLAHAFERATSFWKQRPEIAV
jgi:amidase